jgi:hypothetical protein
VRRTLLVLTVVVMMVAMSAVTALPAFAQAVHNEAQANSVFGTPVDCKLVTTPSSITNVTCHGNPEGGNQGGTGGGGAQIQDDTVFGAGETQEVLTPSGNTNVSGQIHP